MTRVFAMSRQSQREAFCSWLAVLPLPIKVEVSRWRAGRSISQNSRLWMLHTLAADVTGYSAEEMHEEALIRHFGFHEAKMPSGWIKRVPLKRSSDLDTQEFAKFMEHTEAWYATEFGAVLEE